MKLRRFLYRAKFNQLNSYFFMCWVWLSLPAHPHLHLLQLFRKHTDHALVLTEADNFCCVFCAHRKKLAAFVGIKMDFFNIIEQKFHWLSPCTFTHSEFIGEKLHRTGTDETSYDKYHREERAEYSAPAVLSIDLCKSPDHTANAYCKSAERNDA